jgi:predicted flap endonuclease-1-like 5' DNA nuclease
MAARRVASQTKMVRSATLENLKRIRGIGVLNEKKLNRGLRADRHLALARSQVRV